MRMKSTKLSLGLAALWAATLAAGTAARADDPVFVGTWATDLAQCKVGQDRQEAPLVLSKDGYDQYETHCKFKSVDFKDGEWTIASDCTVEGSAEPYNFKLTLSGDTLTVTDDAGARDLLACK